MSSSLAVHIPGLLHPFLLTETCISGDTAVPGVVTAPTAHVGELLVVTSPSPAPPAPTKAVISPVLVISLILCSWLSRPPNLNPGHFSGHPAATGPSHQHPRSRGPPLMPCPPPPCSPSLPGHLGLGPPRSCPHQVPIFLFLLCLLRLLLSLTRAKSFNLIKTSRPGAPLHCHLLLAPPLFWLCVAHSSSF